MDGTTEDATKRSGTGTDTRLISRETYRKNKAKAVIHILHHLNLYFTLRIERGRLKMINIDATLIKDARDVQAYFKQVKEHAEQIQKNIEYERYRTLQLDEALNDIIHNAQEIIDEIDNQL